MVRDDLPAAVRSGSGGSVFGGPATAHPRQACAWGSGAAQCHGTDAFNPHGRAWLWIASPRRRQCDRDAASSRQELLSYQSAGPSRLAHRVDVCGTQAPEVCRDPLNVLFEPGWSIVTATSDPHALRKLEFVPPDCN